MPGEHDAEESPVRQEDDGREEGAWKGGIPRDREYVCWTEAVLHTARLLRIRKGEQRPEAKNLTRCNWKERMVPAREGLVSSLLNLHTLDSLKNLAMK